MRALLFVLLAACAHARAAEELQLASGAEPLRQSLGAGPFTIEAVRCEGDGTSFLYLGADEQCAPEIVDGRVEQPVAIGATDGWNAVIFEVPAGKLGCVGMESRMRCTISWKR